MDLTKLFELQQQLDLRIAKEHGLNNESLFERKVLALLVELGELANETRCFKFWSKKPSSSREVVLEEYVDGIHFILSLGLEKGHHESHSNMEIYEETEDLVTMFMNVYQYVHEFASTPSKSMYDQLVSNYFKLGVVLGFSFDDIVNAYIQKNTINHERQDNGY